MQKSTHSDGGPIIIVADQSRRWILVLLPMALVYFAATLLPLVDSLNRIFGRPAQPRVGWDDYQVVVIITLVNVALLGAAGYVTLRCRKFGRSILKLAGLPVVGGRLVGTIVTTKPIAANAQVEVALLCGERRITGNPVSNLSTLWQTKHAI